MATPRNRRRQLNPAFAAAHGLASGEKENQRHIDHIISQARKTGKVQAANASLTSLGGLLEWPPIQVNLSMESSAASSWEVHVPETVTSLDVTDNAIDWEDGLGAAYPSLVTLRARQCQISRVTALEQHANLQVLDLGGNQLKCLNLTSLPDTLRRLNLSSNQLTDLGEETASLPNLLELDVSGNQLKSLPVLQASALHTLNCENNSITSLEFLQECNSLTTLGAPNNLIAAIPPNLMESSSSLVTLDLGNNRLTGAIAQLPASIVRLVLNDNSLKTLNLNGCTSLVDLLIHGNLLDDVPEHLQECALLKIVDLQNNNIKDLPYQVGFLPHLRTLLLEGNPLRRLRSAVSDLSDTQAVLANLKKRAPQSSTCTTAPARLTSFLVGAKTLSMVDQNLTELPQELLQDLQGIQRVAHQIERFALDGNQLQSIPNLWMQALPNLNTLQAPKNQLTTIPLGTRLRELHLSSNRIETLDNNLPATVELLDLSWNRIGTIDMPRQLRNLRVLDLSGNRLSSLSWKSSPPPSLEVLRLSDNRLDTLDDLPLNLVAQCPLLSTLLLNNNSMSKIPLELGLLQDRLTILNLKGNPQRYVRYAILEKSCTAILEYLLNRMTPQQLQEAQQEVEKRKGEAFDITTASPQESGGSAMKTALLEATVTRGEKPVENAGEATSGAGADVTMHEPVKESPHEASTVAPSAEPSSIATSSATGGAETIPDAKPNKDAAAAETENAGPAEESLLLLQDLRKTVAALSDELSNNLSLSQAKRYAVKKELAMERSKLIREERRLKQLQQS